ncbi:hypothetical protein NL676_007293 [Syzygium grande]|nr:hypothetical protein NL676_007293 [Syzygium grande]
MEEEASVGAQANSGLLDSKLVDRLDEGLQRARCIMADEDASSFLPSKAQGVHHHPLPVLLSLSFTCFSWWMMVTATRRRLRGGEE